MSFVLTPLAGGALIGASAALLLLANGRIAGISGIAGRLLGRWDGDAAWRIAFLVGLLLGPMLYRGVAGQWPAVRIDAPWPMLILGGLLVGYGTRLGSGCTSGHGVCGLARLSPRSLAAVATFMAFAMATVFLVRHGGLSR
ncbi:YeeE/YedE family protein [Methylobacterium sp. WL8]|uniref:YeeE/YedE family protein n=1 Tax=Methylobacterium sp. WL8 TaxID=2603899 RepID=UPI0011C72B9A|nr:YeeE/YedE family protein [Methylobacterium sp. WL8]TXN08374.1 YeeE/YedE family protein [Methylobacterium sp. WL122]TXN84326.1 YeeE/YedE family protein [Methylobacterium sp. WL8]